ncbi:MAG TPA: FAD-dependent oxidoreductase [Syntrophorhabdaceae bacterium]|nr:FAD-dependent oxidoreductase [Syntrophorhabdaceae bacterium]
MPPLKYPTHPKTIKVPARNAVIAGNVDVLVVGGGPAGIGAAIGAAGCGARTVLVERYGFLGGNATAALVMPLASYHTEYPRPEIKGNTGLVPTDQGKGGETITGGVLGRLVERLVKAGGAIPPSLKTGFVVPFDPEIFKNAALNLLDESDVHFLLHAFATDFVTRGSRQHVIFQTKSGPIAVSAKCIVDCTGDGDVAAKSGAVYQSGRDDGLVQPMTLMFRMIQFRDAIFQKYAHEYPDQWRGVHGLWDLIQKATEAGDLNLARDDILFFGTPHGGEVAVNSTRIQNVLGTDVWDLTYAEWQGRKQVEQISAFLRKYVPGFESAYVVQTGTQIGVRESRRIVGQYVLTAADILSARKFEDVIAHGAYPIDIHDPSGKETTLKRVPAGDAYDIPLRCLIPKEIEGMLMAGRCISGTHEALSSYRVMPISMSTGHAAGVCAALSAKTGTTPRHIEAAEVQKELKRQGAIIKRHWNNVH